MLVAASVMPDGRPIAAAGAIDQWREHARAEYPNEAIGYLDQQGNYHRLRNRAADPARQAVPDPREVTPLLAGGDLAVLCHTHPGGPDCPSEQDMVSQQDMDVPFAIMATNGQACAAPFCWGAGVTDNAPLVGRSFRHGVRDCYALVRDWYLAEQGVTLPDYPRGWEWWSAGYPGERDLYQRFFREAGFVPIRHDEVRPGDVWLASVRSPVPNHAGVYLKGGLTIHHPSSGLAHDPNRLSKIEAVARWLPFVTHWLRRT